MTDPTGNRVSGDAALDRLRSATCGSRELDCLIHEWECPAHTVAMRGMYYGEPTGEYYEPEPDRPGGYLVAQAPHYTSSLDAALGLVEHVLPGWSYGLVQRRDKGRVAADLFHVENNICHGTCEAPTAPLAVLIALLVALAPEKV